MSFYTNVIAKGNTILAHEINDEGKPYYFKLYYKPKLYVEGNGPYKDFFTGKSLMSMDFDSIYDMKNYIMKHKDIKNYLWGNRNSIFQFIYDTYGKEIKYDFNKIRIGYVDIECNTATKLEDGTLINGGFPVAQEARYPINAITLYSKYNDTYYVFGLNIPWTPEQSMFPNEAKKTVYKNSETEEELLKYFISTFRNLQLDIISGWNNIAFDIPYIINRINNVLGEKYSKLLSPWGLIQETKSKSKFGNIIFGYDILGMSNLDYMELYRKYGSIQESYTLNYVANAVLGEKKVKFEGTHGSFYYDNPIKFLDYNINDVSLLVKMDDKLGLMKLVTWISYFSGVNYSDTMGPICVWENLIYRNSLNDNIVIPINMEKKDRVEYEGAWVFPTKIGFVDYIVSFDFSSMYPNSNMSWNIGAESLIEGKERNRIIEDLKSILEKSEEKHTKEFLTLLLNGNNFVDYFVKYDIIPKCVTEYLVEKDISMTPNWQFYDRKKESIFTRLQSQLFSGRKADKKLMQSSKQDAKEIMEELTRRGIKL